MTDLAVVEDAPADLGGLVAWAQAATQAHRIALQLAETSFVPKAMQHKPDEVTGAILTGQELGMSPMASLRSIDIIDGTPAMRAHAMRGLLQAHGHEVWVDESTDTRAVVCGRRRKPTQLPVERVTWTIDRARKAGLAGKKNWQAHPAAMLVARATAEVCRRVAADVLLGMPYAIEELTDDAAVETHDEAVARVTAGKPKRTAQRKPIDSPAPSVTESSHSEVDTFDPLPVEAPPDASEEEHVVQALAAQGFDVEPLRDDGGDLPKLTDMQRRKLLVLMREAGMEDRAARLAFAARVVGRELASSNQLSIAEASQVIEALEATARGDEWPDTPPIGGRS